MKVYLTLIGVGGGVIGGSWLYYRSLREKVINAIKPEVRVDYDILIERIIDTTDDNEVVIFGIASPGAYQCMRIGNGITKKLIGFSKSDKVIVYTFDDGSWMRIYKEGAGEDQTIMYILRDTVSGKEINKKINPSIISGYKPINMDSAELDAICELQ